MSPEPRYGVVSGRVLSISRTSTADDLKTVGALNDPNWVSRYGGKESGAGSEEDIDGGNGYSNRGWYRAFTAWSGRDCRNCDRKAQSDVLSPIQRYVQEEKDNDK